MKTKLEGNLHFHRYTFKDSMITQTNYDLKLDDVYLDRFTIVDGNLMYGFDYTTILILQENDLISSNFKNNINSLLDFYYELETYQDTIEVEAENDFYWDDEEEEINDETQVETDDVVDEVETEDVE